MCTIAVLLNLFLVVVLLVGYPLTCIEKNSSEYDSVIRFMPCGHPSDDRLSVDMYEKEPAPNTTVSLDSSIVIVLLMIAYPMTCIERTSSETFGD